MTGLVTPATLAVAVNVPAVPLAVNSGETASPSAAVVSVAWALPLRKLAPAPAAPAPPPPGADAAPRAKVTLAPCTGSTVPVHDPDLERPSVALLHGR